MGQEPQTRDEAHLRAAEIRGVARRARQVVRGVDDPALRRRPHPGEWSAIEVLGHLVDKMSIWHRRAMRVAAEDDPLLEPYDQDLMVSERRYQEADIQMIHIQLARNCEEFARFIETLDSTSLERPCRHADYGPITLRDCIALPYRSVSEHLQQARQAIETPV